MNYLTIFWLYIMAIIIANALWTLLFPTIPWDNKVILLIYILQLQCKVLYDKKEDDKYVP